MYGVGGDDSSIPDQKQLIINYSIDNIELYSVCIMIIRTYCIYTQYAW